MSRFVLLALFVVMAVCSASHLKCKKNQEWTDCGTACPPTCEKPNPGPCTLQCKPGCVCKPGLLKNKCGECVKKSECCKKC